ncbi:MAG: 4Fe-4S dicluster domain-containing protein, partial [Rhodospirillales bacterium]|nr:4Fe-4S dicluster domain-containing protein [Rhodospirillales bacterium]
FKEPGYLGRRREAFIISVACGESAATCFCASMNTGPRMGSGHDLLLSELAEVFVVEIGSARGSEILEGIKTRPPSAAELDQAAGLPAKAAQRQTRRMDADAPRLLRENPDHAQWDDVARRCLTCGNCTMVCPTCFCSTIEDVTSLGGNHAERVRRWDSCFTIDFSYIHGGSVRNEGRSRYRQWITHKLAHWHDQFGTSGCVGCGRCVTWCPVGIDITAEVKAIRDSQQGK